MPTPPLLLGHRGARSTPSVPENTFASFDLALKHGCQGFEFDVRVSACGCAVICHDEEYEGNTISRARVEELTELPRLESVLERYAARAFLDIELKVPGLASQTLAALLAHPPQRGHVVSSFLPEVLLDLRTRSAQIPLGIIGERRRQLDRWRELPVEYVIAHHSLITAELTHEVHKADRMLFAWTVNDKNSMLRLMDWGVDGIVSDKTELLVRTCSFRQTKGALA